MAARQRQLARGDLAGPSDGPRAFTVHVHIIEARELKGRDWNDSSDPVCYVQCGGKKEKTRRMNKTTSCYWDHLMFFEGMNWTPEQLEKERIKVQVFDANTIRRNKIIGSYEFDVKQVYDRPNHEYFRKWAVLTNPDETGTEIQGYLKCSVTILGPGDAPPAHDEKEMEDEDENFDTDNLQDMILKPPDVPFMNFRLAVTLYRGEDFPKMDKISGKCDPYMEVQFGASKPMKSKVLKATRFPTWNEELLVPVIFPTMADRVEVSFFDWNAASSKDLIAQAYFRFSEVKLNDVGPHWINLYGDYAESLRDKTAKGLQKAFRNQDPTWVPTNYLGRVLMALHVEHVDDNTESQVVPESRVVSRCKEPDTTEYTLRIDALEGVELQADASVRLHIQCGPHFVKTPYRSSKKGRVIWYERMQELKMTLPVDINQVPDIIVHVKAKGLLGSSRFGYIIIKPTNVRGFNHAPTWRAVSVDRGASASKKDKLGGFLLMSVDFGRTSELPQASVPRAPLTKPELVQYRLRSYFFQARGLPPADSNGKSDPYCLLRFGAAYAKTKFRPETLNPVWNEMKEVDVWLPRKLSVAPHIAVTVYDYDKVSSDDVLGHFFVEPTAVRPEFPAAGPTWYTVRNEDESSRCGEVLAAFQLIPNDDVAKYPAVTVMPETQMGDIEINLVGLRDLLPFKLAKVKHPRVKFTCPNVTGGEEIVAESAPCSDPNGTNPNHLAHIVLRNVPLPVNPLFMPQLAVDVLDSRAIGTLNVATCSIDLASLVPWATKTTIDTSSVSPSSSSPSSSFALPRKRPVPSSIPGAAPDDFGFEDEHDNAVDGGAVRLHEGAGGAGRGFVVVEIPDDINEVNESVGKVFEFDSPIAVKRSGKRVERIPPRTIGDVPESAVDYGEEGDDDSGAATQDPIYNRPVVKYELENDLASEQPFDTFELFRGTRPKKRGWFSKLWRKSDRSKPSDAPLIAGLMKGSIKVNAAGETKEGANPLRALFAPRDLVVRLYVLRARQLVPADANNSADPYLVVMTDKHDKKGRISLRSEYKKNTLQPDFYRCIEFPAHMPNKTQILVQLWDADATFDDLMGETYIDIEERLLSKTWNSYANKPREFRTLWSPQSTAAQGKLELWVDILTAEEARRNPPISLEPPPPKPYEIRCILWNTRNVVFKDAKMSDQFGTAHVEWAKKRQKTDIHWRSLDGTGMFNWRFVFPVALPCKKPRLNFQLWDKDVLNPNDAIAEAAINLKALFTKAYRRPNPRLTLPRQWISMRHPNYEGIQGEAEVELEIVTRDYAKLHPAGKGRDGLPEPNRPPSSYGWWRVDKKAIELYHLYKWKVLLPLIVIGVIILLILVKTYVPGI